MLIFFSAFNPRFPMNKARINSFCHGESARVPALCFHPVEGFSQQTRIWGGDWKVCKMTFFLVRDFLKTVFPFQRVGLLWLLCCRVREELGGVNCIVVKLFFPLLFLNNRPDFRLPFLFFFPPLEMLCSFCCDGMAPACRGAAVRCVGSAGPLLK